MKKHSLLGFSVLTLAGISLSAPAYAQLATRCTLDDQLSTSLAIGRNAWSRKCGYITAAKEAFLNSEGEYQVYSEGCYKYPNVVAGSSCKKFVPASEASACIGGLIKLGTCVAGCYTASQQLEFDGKFSSIESAYSSGLSTVTALSSDATMDALSFEEQPIRAFVKGDTDEYIYRIEGSNGHQLEVTAEHPMVNADGVIVKAKALEPGDILLGSDGMEIVIQNISSYQFVGTVWNVQPQSHNKIENILNAEGFLTGSVRFQNEWADEHYRLGMRDDFPIDKF